MSNIISESTPERIFVALAAKITIKSNSHLKLITKDGIKTGYSVEISKKIREKKILNY